MAKKVLKTSVDYNIISAGNIELTSNPGGTITLNTGVTNGTTIVTGNLNVLGTTTTVSSTIVDIKDNILVLNYGETGAGVTLGISGIEIDRGTFPNSQILWNESNQSFVMYREKSPLNTLADLNVRSIKLLSGNLVNNIDNDVTLAGNSSSAVTTQYAVKTYIDNRTALYSNFIFQNDSSVTVYDTGTNSYVETIIDGVVKSRLSDTGFLIDQLGSYSTNSNLTITANGVGEVIIEKVIVLPYQSSPPVSAANKNKIYASPPAEGGTGLFFVNTSHSDELVSKRKAILYGIIF
jgi:hypothetical protein